MQITAEQRSKFLLTHASSGFKHALKEVLEDPAVSVRLADTKVKLKNLFLLRIFIFSISYALLYFFN